MRDVALMVWLWLNVRLASLGYRVPRQEEMRAARGERAPAFCIDPPKNGANFFLCDRVPA
jgi:hypothetical protein